MKEIRRLRVLMVTPRYFPYMGGIETHVHEVGRRLVQYGVEVTLLTTAPTPPFPRYPKEETVDGMRVIRVENWLPRKDYYLAPELYFAITHGEWDLIHCQGCHTFVPPLAMLAAKAAKLPFVVTFHTGGHSSGFRNMLRAAQWQTLRPLLQQAAKLIGVSHFEANYFRHVLHAPTEQFAVIPNGGTLPALPLLPTAQAHHADVQASGADGEETLIVSVGRLERYKGHHRLIAALPMIRQQRPHARLFIIGRGPYETALRELAQRCGVAEHVTIRAIPAENRQEMAEVFARAALVTLFSAYEAHPIAVMEALALRCRVLVADTSGLRELAEQGLVRALPLKSTAREIAHAALQQLEEPPLLYKELSLPTWDECASRYQELYESVCGVVVRKEQEQCVS